MKRLGRALAFVLIVAALCLVSVGRAPAANHSGSWDVIATVFPCPKGFLCKRWLYVEPNYGQALKLGRLLTAEGYAVRLEQAP